MLWWTTTEVEFVNKYEQAERLSHSYLKIDWNATSQNQNMIVFQLPWPSQRGIFVCKNYLWTLRDKGWTRYTLILKNTFLIYFNLFAFSEE